MTPVDALIGAMMLAWLKRNDWRHLPPGGLIQRLSAESREALLRLRSDDLVEIPTGYVDDDDATFRRKMRSRALQEIDRKFKSR